MANKKKTTKSSSRLDRKTASGAPASTSEPAETLSYIQEILPELSKMAAAADLKLIVYLLDMAVEEARAETAALMR